MKHSNFYEAFKHEIAANGLQSVLSSPGFKAICKKTIVNKRFRSSDTQYSYYDEKELLIVKFTEKELPEGCSAPLLGLVEVNSPKDDYFKTYQKEKRTHVHLSLGNETDKDIINRLTTVGNKQAYIKSLIRNDIGDSGENA